MLFTQITEYRIPHVVFHQTQVTTLSGIHVFIWQEIRCINGKRQIQVENLKIVLINSKRQLRGKVVHVVQIHVLRLAYFKKRFS